jgi:hypothetical protein
MQYSQASWSTWRSIKLASSENASFMTTALPAGALYGNLVIETRNKAFGRPTRDGKLLYELKHPWRDGTTGFVFTPGELIEKLAALSGARSLRARGRELAVRIIERALESQAWMLSFRDGDTLLALLAAL